MQQLKPLKEKLQTIKDVLNGTKPIESFLPKTIAVWFVDEAEEPKEKPSWYDKVILIQDAKGCEPIGDITKQRRKKARKASKPIPEATQKIHAEIAANESTVAVVPSDKEQLLAEFGISLGGWEGQKWISGKEPELHEMRSYLKTFFNTPDQPFRSDYWNPIKY